MADLGRGTLTRLTFEVSEDETPVWSPDGRHVVFGATRGDGARGVYRRLADGSGPEEMLWPSPLHSHVMDWSPDGRSLLIGVQDPKTSSDLLLLDLESRQARPLIQSRFQDRFGRFSPDGKWLAYGSDESGRDEIYVQRFPALDTRVQVSTGGGTQPIWSRDGRELYYRGANDVIGVAVTSKAPITFGTPATLFADRFVRPQAGDHVTFDVGPDGRFLMIAVPEVVEGTPTGRDIQCAELVRGATPAGACRAPPLTASDGLQTLARLVLVL